MNRSIEHQDASSRMPLGVFLNNVLVATVTDQRRDPYGELAVALVAAERGVEPRAFEVLTLCHRHPQVAAVDCLDCVPEED